MSKKHKKPPMEGWRKSYLRSIAVIVSALPPFEKADAAKKIKAIRPLLKDALERRPMYDGETRITVAVWEQHRLAELNADATTLDDLDQYILHVEATHALASGYTDWEQNKKEEAIRFIQNALDIRHWYYASQGLDAVITICRYTYGLGDFGYNAFSQMTTESYEQRGPWYELSCRGIDGEKAADTDREAWLAGLYAMRTLIREVNDESLRKNVKNPIPKIKNDGDHAE